MVIKMTLLSKITLPTHIKYILDHPKEPVEQNRLYKLYISLGLRPELERTKDGSVWIKYHPTQESQSLDSVVENEAKDGILKCIVSGDYIHALQSLGIDVRRGLLKSLNYTFIKMPEIAFYFCYNSTRNILSHVKH